MDGVKVLVEVMVTVEVEVLMIVLTDRLVPTSVMVCVLGEVTAE